jgi:hypothetical protein
MVQLHQFRNHFLEFVGEDFHRVRFRCQAQYIVLRDPDAGFLMEP